ncbi:MAG: hypothetical protein K8R74_13070 [Bacteroidales bacterium]|nr:hypothetical protein [Bacteroidales bacterium]
MPVKPNKFGTFAGVFTPSVLTILGVIMYMRLGWVVGQAGLISALVIILLAHVISVSTGLSISSIATDKKIRAGGIYYILSRSLGLPMGGAIGIALFIGTALSISLYLVGFAENFLGIESIRTFLGLEQDVLGYRIIGTAAILLLVILAFISTSLAIKTQFYILGAIVLSLVSISVGLFTPNDFGPETIILNPARDAIPLELVFAIFFPAVTGFTAGVAMSGDLKNPKKSIPLGTLASISVGLVIYVALAIIFSYFVNRELLLTDKNFLLRIAWFSPFVIAGIWGATLSSALGGILGGPRILQAISADRITPKIFSKTFGKNNEPRIALIFIFLIAEAGILIGELNIIAGVVSMFYLASYGFINLAFFLESWASSDFRPSFKINRFFGLIGFIAAFGVMFKLDMLYMFAALIIMWGLYFYLKRRKFKSNYGDVWQSVYSSIVRTALHKMDKQKPEERNWKPNIILYSGGTKKRPHLIEFGKCIVGKHGVLSNFDLIENKQAKVLFPKHDQSLPEDDTDFGIFTRKKTVRDIYEGIESISSTYGFSGYEPNTILMGWARQAKDPVRFAQTLNTLYDLDLNVLLLDYDKEAGFGNYNQIDIWWKDISNHGNLALSLTRLIILSGLWQHANVRLLIVNSKNELSDQIFKRAEHLLDGMRINATVRVISNEIEKRPLYDIMQRESQSADLTIIGIPEIIKNKEIEYVKTTNKLLHKIGTVLLIKASSTIQNLSLGVDSEKFKYIIGKSVTESLADIKEHPVKYPVKEELAIEMKGQHDLFTKIVMDFQNEYIEPIFKFSESKTHTIEKYFSELVENIDKKDIETISPIQLNRVIAALKTNILIRSVKTLQEIRDKIISEQKDKLFVGIEYLIKRFTNTIFLIPPKKTITLTDNELEVQVTDHFKSRIFKNTKRRVYSKKSRKAGIKYSIKLRKIINNNLHEAFYVQFLSALEKFGQLSVLYVIDFQKLIGSVNKNFEFIEINQQNQFSKERLLEIKNEFSTIIENLKKNDTDSRKVISEYLLQSLATQFTEIGEIASKIPANRFIPKADSKKIKSLKNKISSAPEQLGYKLNLIHEAAIIDFSLVLLGYRLQRIVDESFKEIHHTIEEDILKKLSKINRYITTYQNSLSESDTAEFDLPAGSLKLPEKRELQLQIDKITDTAYRNIKSVVNKLPQKTELLSYDSLNELTNSIFEDIDTVTISTFQLIDFYIQNNLLEPYLSITGSIPEKLDNTIIKIKDAVRRISFGEDRGDLLGAEIDKQFDKKIFKTFIQEQHKIVQEEISTIKEILKESKLNLNKHIQLTTEDLSIYRLLKSPDKYKRYVRSELDKKESYIKQVRQNLHSKIQGFKAHIWYKQSDALLFAKKMSESEQEKPSVNNSLLNIKEQITPNPGVVDKLPFYYEQLFLKKYNYQSEFWFGRENEIGEAAKAIARYYNGYQGGILIKGNRNSGKTFFANFISSDIYMGSKVYYINNFPAGSCKIEDFTKSLQEATGIKGNSNTIFSKLQKDSLIIIDNLELWWEKNEKGNEVIEFISNLIYTYSSKFIFLITVNSESYSTINQMVELDHYFINSIELKPFNSALLQKIIMFRHLSSGFDLRFQEKPDHKANNSDLAKLFSKHFTVSEGNIGAALLSWISNIVDVQEKVITVKMPKLPDFNIFQNLPPDMNLYLTQFILHKRLDIDKLQRVTFDSKEEVEEKIAFLKRSGVIFEIAGGIYELDKYLYIHLKNKLFDLA